MSAEISQKLKDELRIVEIEEEFLASEPLSRPKTAWLLVVIVGFCILFAILSWQRGSLAVTIGLLALAGFQLVAYQAAKEANHLYDCGRQIIDHYRSRRASGT